MHWQRGTIIMDRKKETIMKATAALTENYKNEDLFMPKNEFVKKYTKEIYKTA